MTYTFTLSEHDAITVRLAMHRALHSVEKILEDYSKLDQVLYLATIQNYQRERENIKTALMALNAQYYAQVDEAVGA